MGDIKNFKEAFSGLYFFAILAVLLMFPLMHVLLGWYTFVISK